MIPQRGIVGRTRTSQRLHNGIANTATTSLCWCWCWCWSAVILVIHSHVTPVNGLRHVVPNSHSKKEGFKVTATTTTTTATTTTTTATLFQVVGNNHHNIDNNNNDNHTNTIFTLGSPKAKKRIRSMTSKANQDFIKLSHEHKRLKQQIAELDNPHKSYHNSIELKTLKRRKLAIKDAIQSLQTYLQDHNNNSNSNSNSNNNNNNNDVVVVGSGGFADVWLGHQVVVVGEHLPEKKKELVAVKLSRSSADNAALLQEAKLIQSLNAYPGFVRVLHVTSSLSPPQQQQSQQQQQQSQQQSQQQQDTVSAVVLDLLGPSLEDLWWSCTCGTGGWSGPTVLHVADEMLQRLHALMRVGIVHRDLQPANMLMGRVGDARKVPHLIDFGISMAMTTTAKSHATGSGSSTTTVSTTGPAPRHAFSGTPRFASVSALMEHGGGNHPADDLESLCYTLAFLRCGSMPWSEKAEYDAMRDSEGSRTLALLKLQTDPRDICVTAAVDDGEDDPAARAIAALLEHARLCSSSGSTTTRMLPDYNRCRRIVKEALNQIEPNKRYAPFDWELQNVTWSSDKGVLQSTLYH